MTTSQKLPLKNQTAVITGSARGIGYAIAEKLASLGANLVINDLTPSATQTAAKTLSEKYSIQAIGYAGDISKPETVKELVKESIAIFPHIEILINNAGITRDTLLLRMTEEQWDAVLNINLKSAFLATQAFLKWMFKQKNGRIINISSIVGVAGNYGQANYAASKGGLIALTKTTALEGAPRNVLANAIAPGFIETPMTAVLPQKVKEQLVEKIPLKRLGTVKDIANVAAFLANPENNYLTGQVFHVNGGMLM